MRSSPKSGGSSMQVERANAEARAIDWLIRQRDPDFTDWDGFADWLAENEAHAAIYDAVASLDRELDALPSASAPSVVILPDAPRQIGRAACRGRGWQYGDISVGGGTYKT